MQVELIRLAIARASLLAMLFLWSCGGGGGSGDAAEVYAITLAWDAPTENADGTDLNDLAGYVIYDGQAPGDYTMETVVGDTTSYTLELPAGTYYFAVTAYDMDGNESDLSAEISATLPLEEGLVPSSALVRSAPCEVSFLDGSGQGF